HLRDRGAHPGDALGAPPEQPGLALEVLPRVRARVVEQRPDLLQFEVEPAVGQDPLQPLEVRAAVAPVAGLCAAGGREQADLVVVVQGPDAHARQAGDLTDRVGRARLLAQRGGGVGPVSSRASHLRLPPEASLDPHVTSGSRGAMGRPAGCGSPAPAPAPGINRSWSGSRKRSRRWPAPAWTAGSSTTSEART